MFQYVKLSDCGGEDGIFSDQPHVPSIYLLRELLIILHAVNNYEQIYPLGTSGMIAGRLERVFELSLNAKLLLSRVVYYLDSEQGSCCNHVIN